MGPGQLYSEYAHYYEIIGSDRDFVKQFALIKSLLPQPAGKTCILELFAGPAYHAVVAAQDVSHEVWAIDSSAEMKTIAAGAGFDPGRYIVGDLPRAVGELPAGKKFDCVICLRYSLGYLDINETFLLLSALAERLSANGRIFIELHEISGVIDSMRSTEIHVRSATSRDDEAVECTWPDGNISWSKSSYLAAMNVSLKISSPAGITKEASFVSKENIHSAELLGFLAGRCGLRCAVVAEKYTFADVGADFKNSILIELGHEKSLI
jgi:hypothetical protein